MTNTLFNRVLVLKKDELGVPEERKILHGKYCLEQFISFFFNLTGLDKNHI